MTRYAVSPETPPAIYRNNNAVRGGGARQHPAASYAQVFNFMLGCRARGQKNQAGGSLVLVGPAGFGKTSLLRDTAKDAGVTLLRFSVADCESSGAGSPAQAFRRLLKKTQQLEDAGTPVLIVIEDWECGLGSARAGEGSSTNRPQLQACLQEALDGTHICDGVCLSPKRMAFTANSLKDIKPSLIREGRASVIKHEPSRKDMAKIAAVTLASIFSSRTLRSNRRALSRLSPAAIMAIKERLLDQIKQMLTFDLDWPSYELWLDCEQVGHLTEAVARRLLGPQDLRHAIRDVQERSKLKHISFD
ncbi:MAG: AAA family ATPase [Phycisphaeraceae bacterium]